MSPTIPTDPTDLNRQGGPEFYPDDWRSGHYGADRLAHLFVYYMGGGKKRPLCGVRGGDTYYRKDTTRANACRECRYRIEREIVP